MGKQKPDNRIDLRSSAAEYLTFIAATGESDVNVIYADENIWLSQKMMGTLYNVETHTINYHLKKIFSDHELDEESVIRNFRITAQGGKHYNTQHYNLSAINAVAYDAEIAKAHAESEFEKYRVIQDRLFESDFDKVIKKQLQKGGEDE